jgi:hypothetical protein
MPLGRQSVFTNQFPFLNSLDDDDDDDDNGDQFP